MNVAVVQRELMDRYDQRSLRERLLLLAAVIGLIAVLWDALLMAPLRREAAQHAQAIEQLRAEVGGLEASLETLKSQPAAPDADARAALDALRAEIAALDARLGSATSGLIEPREMAKVLERVLAHSTPLTLRALRSLPPEPLLPPPAADAAAAGTRVIYKHGLELELAGTWLDTLRLLEELEALPWRFFWDRVDYAVEKHPQGAVRLRLYTLGLHEGWIGV